MKRLNKIINSGIYKEYLKKLNEYEKDRVYCKHDYNHFINLSRIAYIQVLEAGLEYSKEVIYTIGFLHDIGRVLEFEKGVAHHIGSVLIAEDILKESDFTELEISYILEGIENHRKDSNSALGKIICKSDKLSRDCMNCEVITSCHWSEDIKNKDILY